MEYSIDNIPKEPNLSCVIVDRRKFFINFNLENDLSPLATDTGMVNKILRHMETFGKLSFKLFFVIKFRTSKGEQLGFLTIFFNTRSSLCKLSGSMSSVRSVCKSLQFFNMVSLSTSLRDEISYKKPNRSR